MLTILIITIIIALVFEFINGFHDTANSIATSVATKVLTPKQAIIMASILNLVGALASSNVAKTVSSGLLHDFNSQYVIISALLSAIIWNLITWYFGIPSSSSHALIGGLLGSAITFSGTLEIVKWSGVLSKILIPLLVSPLLGFILALIINSIIKRVTNKDNKIFNKLQILSAGLMAFSHGNNDAQKTMGIITMALVSAGFATKNDIPLWVTLICAITMALGTSMGGWRIIKTLGEKITELTPRQGFVAETSAAMVIELMTFFGKPISTTHVISSTIVGVGASGKPKSVRWEIVTNMLWTWLLTIPVTSLIGAGIYLFISEFI